MSRCILPTPVVPCSVLGHLRRSLGGVLDETIDPSNGKVVLSHRETVYATAAPAAGSHVHALLTCYRSALDHPRLHVCRARFEQWERREAQPSGYHTRRLTSAHEHLNYAVRRELGMVLCLGPQGSIEVEGLGAKRYSLRHADGTSASSCGTYDDSIFLATLRTHFPDKYMK